MATARSPSNWRMYFVFGGALKIWKFLPAKRQRTSSSLFHFRKLVKQRLWSFGQASHQLPRNALRQCFRRVFHLFRRHIGKQRHADRAFAGALGVRQTAGLVPEAVVRLLQSEEHTSELQSHSFISYAVFCLKKK